MRTGGKMNGVLHRAKPKPAQGSDGRFLPGNSGGQGRPVGARNKLSEAFLEALSSDFDKHGIEVIERVRAEDPAAYLRTVASLTPKKVEMEATGSLESMTDAELEALIRLETEASRVMPVPRERRNSKPERRRPDMGEPP